MKAIRFPVRLIAICLLFLTFNIFSQEIKGYFENFTTENGLPQNSIHSICQDDYGFLWFGTYQGLAKYDGYKFTIYKNNTQDPWSISHNDILCLFKDSQGILWAGTEAGGLNQYELDGDRFVRFTHDPGDPDSISSNDVFCIIEDAENVLWIGTKEGLNKFDKKTKKFTALKFGPTDQNSINQNLVNCLALYDDNSLLVGTENGLYIFNIQQGEFTSFHSASERSKVFTCHTVSKIQIDHHSNIWIGSPWGICILDRSGSEKALLEGNDILHSELKDITAMFVDSLGVIWFGALDSGLYSYDPSKNELLHFKYEPLDDRALGDKFIKSVYEDKSGIIWIGTYYGGLYKFDRRKNIFGSITSSDTNKNSLTDKVIRSIYEDSTGKIWIGTRNGLEIYHKDQNSFSHYSHDPDNNASISNNTIYSVLELNKNKFLIGTFNGLNQFDTRTKEFKRYYSEANNPNSLAGNKILKIIKDRDGFVWMATKNGISKYDPVTEEFTNYRNDPHNPKSLIYNSTYYIYEDSYGDIWVGTFKGLDRFDKNTESFTHYVNDSSDSGSLSYNSIFSVYEDKNKTLWITTWYGGLNKFIRETETFVSYTENDGLSSNMVYGIMEDDRGNLWLSCNNGISKFDPMTAMIQNFNKNDGIIAGEFNFGAFYKSENGYLYFGTGNGIIYFDPLKQQNDSYSPVPVLTGFELFNEPVNCITSDILEHNIMKTNKITLNYDQKTISFEFAAMNFSAPSKTQYAYYLKNFDNTWINTNKRNYVTYTNLDPGNYSFLLKAANKDGVWSKEVRRLDIEIRPPIWQSIWAYIVYILLLFGVVIGIIRFRLNKEKQNYQLRLKEMEIKNMKDLHEQKSNIFINLVHETKTPLTLIYNYLDVDIKKRGMSDEINIVKKNLGKLTQDMLNFLDFEKLHKNQIFYDHEQICNISSILNEKIILFKEVAKKKDITINSDIEKNIYIKIDNAALDKIINNVVDNSIKYTNFGGNIHVLLRNSENNKVNLIIKDDGIGIPQNKIKSVFEPYRQISYKKRNIEGMGMGLAIVKKIIDDVRGEIEIVSTESIGTNLKIIFCKYDLKSGDNIVTDIELSKPLDNILDINIEEKVYNKNKNTILLVEDNIEMLLYLYNFLKDNYNVYFASNGKEALLKLRNIVMPDIIISDIMMDVMDGYEFIENLFSDEDYKNIPVIFLTALSDQNEKLKGLSKSAVDYIVKPFSIKVLLTKIKSIIEFEKKQRTKEKKILLRKLQKFIDAEILELDNHQMIDQNCKEYSLTNKEIETVKLILKGFEYKEISSELNISINTLKHRVTRIYSKCKVGNKIELANAITKNMISNS